jgi:hypothetical protein
MKRRSFLTTAVAGAAVSTTGCTTPGPSLPRNAPLSNDYSLLWNSPQPANIQSGKPLLAVLPSGRLVAGHNISQRGKDYYNFREDDWGMWRNKLYYSDDRGQNWNHTADHPVTNGRLIFNGDDIYLFGGADGMQVMRSQDQGESWTGPYAIIPDGIWYNEPTNHLFSNGHVFLVMNKITRQLRPATRGTYAPVVFSARVGDDWTQPDAWTKSNIYTFDDAIAEHGSAAMVGIPFYPYGFHAASGGDRRPMYKIGWWEPNIVQISDPEHLWYDPDGRTFHIFQRAPVGKTNIAALCKATVADDGAIKVSLQLAPSGESMLFVPFPGGHGMFNIQYDSESKLYWLLSQQSYDSMKKIELFNPKRWNLGHHERHRFALHFSKNCVDWCFAGLLANTEDVGQSRHCASFVFDGSDLHWLSRSAGPQAKNAHDADMITFHTVHNFRDLVY